VHVTGDERVSFLAAFFDVVLATGLRVAFFAAFVAVLFRPVGSSLRAQRPRNRRGVQRTAQDPRA
jgi:hypothetical protein